MLTTMRRVLSLLALVSIGCGGSVGESAASDGGGDGSGPDAAAEVMLGDGGCLLPTEGAACKSTDAVCPPVGNVCCIGYVWSCDPATGTWRKLGLGCACPPEDAGADDTFAGDVDVPDGGAFACGSSTCNAGEICTRRPPGIPVDASPPPLYYSCYPMPAACKTAPTCECVKANIGGSCYPTDCTIEDGHVVLGCMGV